jgi:heat shock protein HslJ
MRQLFKIQVVLMLFASGLCLGQIVEVEVEDLIEVPEVKITTSAELEGLWEVHAIYDKFKPFEELFPGKKPRLYFDILNRQIFGFTGCNNFSIFTELAGNEIDVMGFLGMTKVMCDGDGEDIFLTLLKSAHTFVINEEGSLSFLCGSMEIMRLEKVNTGSEDHPFAIPGMVASGPRIFWLYN